MRPHGAGRAHQDQERDGLDGDVQEVVQGGHLRVVRHEHWRSQHPRLHQVLFIIHFCVMDFPRLPNLRLEVVSKEGRHRFAAVDVSGSRPALSTLELVFVCVLALGVVCL